MAEFSRWYVVHTYSGYENKVAANLETVVENRKMHDYVLDIQV
ncbi:MAG TPA: transcription termination/antitermination protein NusG, partial [Ruminococcaceae bacterium]|nr:transcription termination/antitermination protein NusG [Oscillospiraceae bacterium]